MTKFLTYIFIFLFTFTSSVNAGYFVKSESGLGVFGHEIGHSMYGDDEVTAGYLGSRFADAYTDGLWINGEDYSLGNWNVADENSLYVGQNGVDFSGVKNRDDFEPISLTLTGLTIAGSIYSIQDSARKIYSWIEGEGYKGNTTYIDPIDGRTYTAEGNIKEGAIELATAAAISGAFKIGGKVVGKIKNGINKSLDSITFGFDDVLPKETLPALVLKSGQELHTTTHLFDRMLERNISFKDITDVLKNPLGISKVKMDKFGPSYKIVGKNATVIINPETNTLITTYKTTSNAKRLKQILDKL